MFNGVKVNNLPAPIYFQVPDLCRARSTAAKTDESGELFGDIFRAYVF